MGWKFNFLHMNYISIIFLSLGGMILTLGDIVMKKWVSANNWYVFSGGLLIWLVGNSFLAFSFKYENIAVASTILVIFNVVTLSLVSWLYFKEPLSVYQIIGVVLSLVLVAFLELVG